MKKIIYYIKAIVFYPKKQFLKKEVKKKEIVVNTK